MKRLAGLLLLSLVVAACSGRTTTITETITSSPPTAAPAPAATATPAPTLVDVYAGDVIFGTKVTNDLKITVPKTTFDRNAKDIAWAAHFTEPAGAPTLTWMVLKQTGGSEQIKFTEKVKVSPDWTITSSHSALPKFLGNKAGKYIMRYVRGSTVLAEGAFTLK